MTTPGTTGSDQPAGSAPDAPSRDVQVVPGYHDDVRLDVVPHVPRKSGTLVDIGGGTGATAAHLKSLGLAGKAGVVDQVSPDPSLDVDFHHSGELEDRAFMAGVIEQEGQFDTILCLDILEHLVDPWGLVQQLHEALAPGGHIVASIPNVRHYRVSGGLFFRNRWSLQDAGILDRTHLRFFVKETAVEMMTHTGLELEYVVSPPRMRHPKLARVVHRVGFGRLDSFVDVDYIVRVRRVD
jgi:2-polyprenyl-3-methyl-5-hydroxy-6-metoxy-1,4-benzoquinol methylase